MRFSISDYFFSNSWLSRCLRCRSIGSVRRDWVGLHRLHSQKMCKCTETRNALKYEKRHTSPADFHCLSRYAFSTYSFESDLISLLCHPLPELPFFFPDDLLHSGIVHLLNILFQLGGRIYCPIFQQQFILFTDICTCSHLQLS